MGKFRWIYAALGWMALSVAGAQQSPLRLPNLYAIEGAKLVTLRGAPIENGTILVNDGKILDLGAGLKVPEGYARIDGKGLTVYPGLIDAYTTLGMPAGADPAYDAYDLGSVLANPNVRPERHAASLFRPSPAELETSRRYGFTLAHVTVPNGILTGQTALIRLGSATAAESIVRESVAAGMNLAPDVFRPRPSFGYPESLMGAIALTRQSLAQVQRPGAEAAWTPSTRALKRVLDGETPLLGYASDWQQAQRVLRIADEFGCRPWIAGGSDIAWIARSLKAKNVPVVLTLELSEPMTSYDPLDPPSLTELRARALEAQTPSLLAKERLTWAIGTGRTRDLNRFWRNVRIAIANGLSEEDALAALTKNAAEMLGVGDRVGSLAKGMEANLVLAKGSLFARRPDVKQVFVGRDRFVVDEVEEEDEDERPDNPPRRDEHKGHHHDHEWDRGVVHEIDSCCLVDLTSGQVRGVDGPRGGREGRRGRGQGDAVPIYPAAVLEPTLPTADPHDTWLIRNATLLTMTSAGRLEAHDLLIRDGKIVAIGRNLAPGDARVIDARGKLVLPGIIDCHSHIAISGDVNDGSNSCTVEVRIRDVVDAADTNIYRQLAAGVTAANLLHGSANTMGGQNQVIKFRWGQDADGLLFREAPEGVKFALGENVTAVNWRDRDPSRWRFPATRLGVEQFLRDRFQAALDYKMDRANRPRDLQMEALVEILEGKRLVHCHSYRQAEILMLMRLAEEFGFRIQTFQHVLDGYKVADELAKHGVGASCFADWWAFKFETYDAIPWAMSIMYGRGVNVSINSDSADHARRLNLEAAKAVKYGGVPDDEALKMITINPAKQLGIDRWVGNLEVGKSADLAIWDGDPLSTASTVEKTFVDGKLAFDRERDRANRAKLEVEHQARLKPLTQAEALIAEIPAGARLKPSFEAMKTRRFDPSGRLAVINAEIYPVSGPVIPRGTVLVENGKIVAVGPRVPIPTGTQVIDAAGGKVYPGLIDADTQMGLSEIGLVAATVDTNEMGSFNPNARAEIAVSPDSEFIPVTRLNGVTSTLTVPSGGTLAGQACLLSLDGYTWEEMAVASPVAVVMNFPRPPSDPGDDISARRLQWKERLAELNRFMDDARRYHAAAKAGLPMAQDQRLAALMPVIEGRTPFLARVGSAVHARAALEWCARQNVRLIVTGPSDLARAADLFKKHDVPVILDGVYGFPRAADGAYDEGYRAAARLAEAGVLFCIATGSNMDSRNLPYHAGSATAHGLSPAAALRAITLDAARLLGVSDRLGSIEVGIDANFFLTDGDLFDIRTTVRQVVINGRAIPMQSRQTRLWERYRDRPRSNR